MLDFNEFILERLGYSGDIEKLTTYVIDYIQDDRIYEGIVEIDVHQFGFGISKVIIELIKDYEKDHNRYASFNQHLSKYVSNKSVIYLMFDIDNMTHGRLSHELFHGYDWVKNKGKEITGDEEMSIIAMFDYFADDIVISDIIDVVYSLSSAEVKANFHEVVYEINHHDDDVKVEETEFYEDYIYYKDVNLEQEFSKLSKDKLNEFISVFELLKGLDHGDEGDLNIINYSKEEQTKFIRKVVDIYDKQIKIYSKYISRLYSYLN
jgi:hypothetical protein